MNKIKIKTLNENSDSIWKLLTEAVRTKSWPLIVNNLNRMHKLQDYYCKLLTIQAAEIEMLKQEERFLNSRLSVYEKNELIDLTKTNGTYQTFKQRIDELFQEN